MLLSGRSFVARAMSEGNGLAKTDEGTKKGLALGFSRTFAFRRGLVPFHRQLRKEGCQFRFQLHPHAGRMSICGLSRNGVVEFLLNHRSGVESVHVAQSRKAAPRRAVRIEKFNEPVRELAGELSVIEGFGDATV